MICRAEVAAAPAAEAAAPEAAAGVEVKQEGGEQPAEAPADQHMADAGAAAQPADGVEARQEHEQDRERDRERGGPRGGRGGGGREGVDLGSFKLPADAMLKQDIPLPRRMASCVIGIKGQSVSKLRRESGAKIHVRPAVGRDEMDQVVEIEGAIESVSAWLWPQRSGLGTHCVRRAEVGADAEVPAAQLLNVGTVGREKQQHPHT